MGSWSVVLNRSGVLLVPDINFIKYTIKAWKRPVSRSYEFNLQVQENYYKHFTDYLDVKNSYGGVADIPGALTYTERLTHNPIHGRTSVKLVTNSSSYFSHSSSRTFVAN